MKRLTFGFGALILLIAFGFVVPTLVRADDFNWPDHQLLPHFPAPAETLDCIDLNTVSESEADLFASLEGIVNRAQPRVVCARKEGEGKFTWVDLHHLHYNIIEAYDAVLKYRTNFTGLVVIDPEQPDTLNLATTIAGVNNKLICHPRFLAKLTNAPYNLPIADDLRGKFADKYAVYGYLYTNYWSKCTHRIFAGMGPHLHGCLREYLVAVKAATVWLGPGQPEDAKLLRSFVSDMKPLDGIYLGWWPGEGDGLKWIAQYGIPVLASDFMCNASVFSGVRHPINIPPIPPPPPLENKIYVALILSDGDNIQYMQHAMKTDWDKPVRGTIPLGWTASPMCVDMDPMMLDYFWSTATTNDCLVSGPSGAGYTHINDWNATNISAFAKLSAPYLEKSGLRIITIWDRVNKTVASAFATNCPSLLGLTDQGKYSAVDHGLRTIKLTPAYTSSVTNLIADITRAASHFDGKNPIFIAAQSDVWNVGQEKFVEVAQALDPAKYKLVRPDQLFILANQAQKGR